MNPDNTPKEIQMDKTMEWVKRYAELREVHNMTDSIIMLAKEIETLTNKSRDEEIDKLKKEIDGLKRHIAEIVYISEQPGGYHP